MSNSKAATMKASAPKSDKMMREVLVEAAKGLIPAKIDTGLS